MQSIIFILIAAALTVVNALMAWSLAYILTEVFALPWKFKPFNCRACLSFWLTLTMGIIWAVVLGIFWGGPELSTEARLIIIAGFIAVAFLVGLINYLYIKTKFKVYE